MYDPKFKETLTMCDQIAKYHAGQMEYMELKWHELRDTAGDVYQIVPLLKVVFK